MTDNPYDSPHAEASSAKAASMFSPGKVLAAVGLVLLVGLCCLPQLRFPRGAREVARANTCRNNLKDIALAFINYAEEHHELPQAYTVDAQGKRLHSWRTLILPYLDRKDLYEKIDLTKPWNDPVNQAAAAEYHGFYCCPSSSLPDQHTTYFVVHSPDGCFPETGPRKRSEITDDAGLTLLVVEMDSSHSAHWMSPEDVTEADVLAMLRSEKMPHVDRAHCILLDGKVGHLSASTTAAQLRALVTVAGNDYETAEEAFSGTK